MYIEKATGLPGEITNYTGRMEGALSLSNVDVMYALTNAETLANQAVLFKSTDGGDTWYVVNVSDDVFTSANFGNYSNTIWVDPLNSDHIYLGGINLWKSTNGGVTLTEISDWTQYHVFNNNGISTDCQLHADQHIIIPSLSYSSENPKVYIGNDGGIQKADSIGATNNTIFNTGWDNLAGSSLGITQFYGASASPHNGDLGGGAQDNGFLVKPSAIWKQPSTGDGSMFLFHPNDADIMYANVNYNKLFQSKDGGQVFNLIADLGETESLLIAPIAINKQNTDLVYLGGKRLWKYDDSNGTTTVLKDSLSTGDFITSIAVDDAFRSIWIGYDNGVVEYTENGGSTWSGDISTGGPNGFITDIDIRPFGPDGLDVIVTVGGYRQDNLWKHTENGGNSTWENISLGFDMHVNTVTHHPTNFDWIYVGTDVGIFASEDNGTTWSITPLYSGNSDPALNNEGPVFTEVTDLFWDYDSFSPGNNLMAATFGRGIWRSGVLLDKIYVDLNAPGPYYFGTSSKPYNNFKVALEHAGNSGAQIILRSADTHNEVPSTILMDKRVLIDAEGGSTVIE
jgi:hypothetical protein